MKKIFSLFMALAIMAFVASPALATDFTVGNDTSARTQVDTYQNFVIVDTNNPAAFTGKLTSFNYYASNTNHFRFVLVEGLVVKWVSDEITPAATGVNTYTPSSPISVNSGWNLGMYFVSTGVIPFEYMGSPAIYTPNNYGLPVVGTTLNQQGTSGRTYSLGASGVYCTQTGFFRDGINMTAALINPTTPVSGTVNATGCNIGVYFDQSGAIDGANIYGSNYFGVSVNGDTNNIIVDVKNSSIHDIGETPLNGSQHGVAIYYRAFGTGSIIGEISGNTVTKYQKGGIVVNGKSTVDTLNNVVTGEGAVTYIAQNGIQYGYGPTGQIQGNTVSGHSYSGSNYASDGGILVVGGACYGGDYTKNVQIVKNVLINNDVGVYLSNLDKNCVAPTTMTNVKVVNNTISNDAVTNTSGYTWPDRIGYQAGISNVGKNDKLINNKISGLGYTKLMTDAVSYLRFIDADSSFTNAVKIHANKFQ